MGSPSSMGETVPVGYRFLPTDEELVGHYLKYKLLGDDSRVQNTIAEVDVCKFEPWDLPAFSKVKSDDPEWFFYSPRDLKYTNSNRYNRTTRAGFWKATGKDRDIKTRGTNIVIGKKKTLVFHKGRVPSGVKTNWVIHEYHAVTSPDDRRTFVLCRLKKKAEKKAESRTDDLINEGEPIAADHENQEIEDRIPELYTLSTVNLDPVFLEPHRADEYDFSLHSILEPHLADEYDFSSLQPNLIGQEVQEPYFQDSIFINDCFGNENNTTQFPIDTTEEEDDLFLNSILVDGDVFISEERRNAFVHDSTPSQSLRKVYYESNETDTELVSARYASILDTTSACNEHAVSRRCQVMKMVKTSQDAVYAGPRSLSPKTKVNHEKDDSTFDDNFWGVDTSGDSTANKYVSVIESVSSPSPPSTSRRSKTKHHPGSDNFVPQRAAPRRFQTQRKVSSKEVSQREVQKETDILESNKDQRKAQDVRSRKNLETTCNQSSSINEKDSFIYLETPSICQNPNPRSVYLVNVVIGILLLIVTIWDMLSFGGKCC